MNSWEYKLEKELVKMYGNIDIAIQNGWVKAEFGYYKKLLGNYGKG